MERMGKLVKILFWVALNRKAIHQDDIASVDCRVLHLPGGDAGQVERRGLPPAADGPEKSEAPSIGFSAVPRPERSPDHVPGPRAKNRLWPTVM